MKSIIHQVLTGPPYYLVVGIYVGIGITLTGVSLSQVVVMIVGVFILLLASIGLLVGKED